MNRPTCYGYFPYLGLKCLGCQFVQECATKTINKNLAPGKTVELHEVNIKVQDKAVKQDDKQPTPELLPFAALVEVSEVLAYGARKYAPGNWRKGLLWSRLLGAALRHLFAWGAGEAKDPETGRNHLAHAACCILFLLEYEQVGGYAHLDDRDYKRTLK